MVERHIISGEYPPQRGGVSDYTQLVAAGLAAAGERVHVWCPATEGESPSHPGVVVQRELGSLSRSDLRRASRRLDRHPGPRRLLVQWVPHAYGYRSMNLGFCAWIRSRARQGDRVELMVHEPFLEFRGSAVKQSVAATLQRVMTVVLLSAAERVWVAAPEWERFWRPYSLTRRVPFVWLPIPSNVPVEDAPDEVGSVRRLYAPGGEPLVGHFGTYGRGLAEELAQIVVRLAERRPDVRILLLGRGGHEFLGQLLQDRPELGRRVQATGGLARPQLSHHLNACDLLVQPYPFGVNARRGSFMAALSHARPTVTSDGRMTEEMWSESGAVVLTPDGDAEAMAAAAADLLSDPEARRRLSQRADRLYRDRFALENTIRVLRESP
jgi:glycosyltransferase involved in cell wall biosynthesis